MPLAQGTINFLNNFIHGSGEEGESTLNSQVNALVSCREDVLALLRIHADVDDDSCAAVLATAKVNLQVAVTALQALVDSLP